MAILKASLRIIFLMLLCMPIVYIQYYMIKTTIDDVMDSGKKKSLKSANEQKSYHTREYLKIAK